MKKNGWAKWRSCMRRMGETTQSLWRIYSWGWASRRYEHCVIQYVPRREQSSLLSSCIILYSLWASLRSPLQVGKRGTFTFVPVFLSAKWATSDDLKMFSFVTLNDFFLNNKAFKAFCYFLFTTARLGVYCNVRLGRKLKNLSLLFAVS